MGEQHGKRKRKEKKRKGKERTEGKQNQSMLTGSLHYCTLLLKEFLLFLLYQSVTPVKYFLIVDKLSMLAGLFIVMMILLLVT